MFPTVWGVPGARVAILPGGILARQSKVSALCLVAPRLVDEFFAALPVRVPHRHPGFLTISSGVGRFPFTGGGGAHGPGHS